MADFPLSLAEFVSLFGLVAPTQGQIPTISAAAIGANCEQLMPWEQPAIAITINNPNAANLVPVVDASFESGIGSAVGTNCVLSDSGEAYLDGFHSLGVQAVAVAPQPSQQVGGLIGATPSTTLAITLPGAINAGDGIVVLAGTNGTGYNVSGITGGSGATWTRRNVQNNSAGCEIWDSLAQTSQPGGTTVTLTFQASASFQGAIVIVVPGLGAFDKASGATGTSTTPTTPSITPAAAGEFIFAVRMDGHTWLPTAGPTNGFIGATPTPNNETAAYLYDTTAAAISTGWTVGGTPGWSTCIAAYTVTSPAITVTLGPYSLEADTEYTVMANFDALTSTCSVALALQFYDINDHYINGADLTASGSVAVGAWMAMPGVSAIGNSPAFTDHAYIVLTFSGVPEALPPPSPVTVTPTGTTGAYAYAYKVTSLNALGESLASSPGLTATGNATLSLSNYNALAWPAVPNASGYNIYRGQSPTCGELAADFTTCAAVENAFTQCQGLYQLFFGSYEKIGNTSGTTFSDTGLAANPPAPPIFNSTGGMQFIDEVGIFEGAVSGWEITPPGTFILQRSDGNYVRGASPLFPLVFTAAGTYVVYDYDAPYGQPVTYVGVLQTGVTASVPTPPTTAVTMGQAPDTCTLWRRTGWAEEVDEENNYVLLNWLSGIGEWMQTIGSVARDEMLPTGDVSPGWSQLLDINRAPTEALPWLGQFVGARLTSTLRDDQMRWLIQNSPAWARGTPGAIIAAANLYLQPGYSASIAERTPDPYSLTVTVPNAGVIGYATCLSISLALRNCATLMSVFPTCAAMWGGIDAVEMAIRSNIPAGLIATITFV